MADFNQAVKWLEEGKRINRRSWGGADIYVETFFQLIGYRDKRVFCIDMDDIRANDWELFAVYTEGVKE